MAMQILHYAGCETCRKARRWLASNGVSVTERPIVEQPPTRAELAAWVPASGIPLRKWLNTSGQSYRALGKERVAAMTDAQLIDALSKDGKLVKRPVLVDGKRVIVGFDPKTYATFVRKS